MTPDQTLDLRHRTQPKARSTRRRVPRTRAGEAEITIHEARSDRSAREMLEGERRQRGDTHVLELEEAELAEVGDGEARALSGENELHEAHLLRPEVVHRGQPVEDPHLPGAPPPSRSCQGRRRSASVRRRRRLAGWCLRSEGGSVEFYCLVSVFPRRKCATAMTRRPERGRKRLGNRLVFLVRGPCVLYLGGRSSSHTRLPCFFRGFFTPATLSVPRSGNRKKKNSIKRAVAFWEWAWFV